MQTQKQKTKVQHIKWDDVPIEQMNSMLDRQYVTCENVMVARIVLKKGCTVPEHSHENEQISYLESGAMQFVVDGKETLVRAGEMLLLPPGVPHSATAIEDTVALDFFNPPRQDWLEKRDTYLRG